MSVLVVVLVVVAIQLWGGYAGPLEPLEEGADSATLGDESAVFLYRDESPWDGWLYGGLTEGMLGFTVESEDPQCSRDGQLYRQHLDNLTLWAVRMFDSSAMSANGLLSADGFQMGHFDECVVIETEIITGKYCLATVQLGPDPGQRPRWYDPPMKVYTPLPATAHAWDRMKVTDDPRQLRRDTLRWAVCVPSSCSAEDVGRSLSRSLAPPLARRGIRSEITVTSNDCYSIWEAPPFSNGYYIVMSLICFLLFLCSICTAVDYITTDDSKMRFLFYKLVRFFSMDANMRQLVKCNPEAEFEVFHFFKFFCMSYVIIGHKEMYIIGRPIHNSQFLESLYSSWTAIFLINGGNFITDTFFMISGFLTCHFLVKELMKGKGVSLPAVIVIKLMRILPVYVLAIAFHAVVLPHLGSGPLWNELVWREAQRCQRNWWTNVLFINNYVNVDDMCMFQSWYLGCDMHFFLAGIALIIIRHRHNRLGNALIAATLALSVAVPMYITYVNRYWGSMRQHHGMEVDLVKFEHFRIAYVPSHARFTPYILGIVFSYVSQHLINIGFKFPVPWMVYLFPFLVLVNVTTTCVAFAFYIEERPYSLLENAIYAGVCRILWAVTLLTGVIIETTTGLGRWASIMRHPVWVPLSRLTYCTYLLHTIPMLYTTGMMRSAPYHSQTMAALALIEEVGISFSLALVVNLIFESPLLRIMKMALEKTIGGDKPTGISSGEKKNSQQVGSGKNQLTTSTEKPKLPSAPAHQWR